MVKKKHTVKQTIISNERKEIIFLGKLYGGRHHDFELLKLELNIGDKKAEVTIFVDLGYIGIVDLFPNVVIKIPHKKPRKSAQNPHPALSKEQKKYNTEVGKERVVVEHSIAGIKRFYSISNRIRVRDMERLNNAILMSAALWNFRKLNKSKLNT